MLPLRDNVPSGRFPVVTFGLIGMNILVFFKQLAMGNELGDALLQWALIPALYTHPEFTRLFSLPALVLPFFTSMFLHGGWIHLIGNMWTLWIFGDNVEDRLGRLRFLGFYVLGGIVAGVFHILTNPGSPLPTIGASGAVAGVMGAYFRFFPHAKVETIIPPFFLGPIFELPAVLFLGWWILLQFFNGAMSLVSSQAVGGVAWWAHVGGFVFGMLLCLTMRRRPPRLVAYRLENEVFRE